MARAYAFLLFAALLWACDEARGTAPSGGGPTDGMVVSDARSREDSGAQDGASSQDGEASDVDRDRADGGADARAFDGSRAEGGVLDAGSDDGGGPPPTGAPGMIYEGLLASGMVPGWNPASPRPLVVAVRRIGSSDWVLGGCEVHTDGRVRGIVGDRLRIWGWDAGGDGSPRLAYQGPRSGARVATFDPSAPDPLIVLATNTGSDFWWVTMAHLSETGVVQEIAADRIQIWSFDGVSPPPRFLYDGPPGAGALVPGWSASPPPISVLASDRSGGWYVAVWATIRPNGQLAEVATNRFRVFGW